MLVQLHSLATSLSPSRPAKRSATTSHVRGCTEPAAECGHVAGAAKPVASSRTQRGSRRQRIARQRQLRRNSNDSGSDRWRQRHSASDAHCATHDSSSAELDRIAETGDAESDGEADPEKRAEFLKLIGANWIWSPAYAKDEVPVGDCYFRKTFSLEAGRVRAGSRRLRQPVRAVRQRPAGRQGRRLAEDGRARRRPSYLLPGTNVVAIKATNTDAGAAGLVARVIVKERGGTYESFSTDDTWRTSVKPPADWTQPEMRDTEWLPAKVYGPLGGVLPWGDEIVIADEGSRFLIDPEFVVERLVTDEQAGSLIAMAFNANGDILASQEGGAAAADPRQGQGRHVRNGRAVLRRSEERAGHSVARQPRVCGRRRAGRRRALSDHRQRRRRPQRQAHGAREVPRRDRRAWSAHGAARPRWLAVRAVAAISRRSATTIDPRSPYATTYEGDLVQPRYEDPQGHAVGVPAPGGTILRTDTNGSFVEMVAGGFRNPYDFAFNGDGELFTYDADMEWDIGAPWYRPTRVDPRAAGRRVRLAERLGEVARRITSTACRRRLDIGPGSPTGVVFYDHMAFPAAVAKHAVRRRLGAGANSRGEARARTAQRTRRRCRRSSKAGRST